MPTRVCPSTMIVPQPMTVHSGLKRVWLGHSEVWKLLNGLRPRIGAGRQPQKQESYATQTETKTKGVETPNSGGRYLGQVHT